MGEAWTREERVEKFWERVVKTPTCWLWTGCTRRGWGLVEIGGRRKTGAHRFAYELATGQPVPQDMHVDHLCRVRPCVRPDHLEVVTPEENARRSRVLPTHCLRGHPLAGENLRREVRDGKPRRRCRACEKLVSGRNRLSPDAIERVAPLLAALAPEGA